MWQLCFFFFEWRKIKEENTWEKRVKVLVFVDEQKVFFFS